MSLSPVRQYTKGMRGGWPYGLENPMTPMFLRQQMDRAKGGVIGTNGKAAIALRFDHAKDFGTKCYPKLRDLGIPASLAHCSDMNPQTAGDTTWDDIRTWNRNGIEIWSHSHTHNDPQKGGYAAYLQEIVTTKAIIEAQGVKCPGWALPGVTVTGPGEPWGAPVNSWDLFTSTLAGRLLTNTWAITELNIGSAQRPIPARLYHGTNHSTQDSRTLAQFQSEVDGYIRRKSGVEFMWHPWLIGTDGFMSQADFESCLDYLATKRDAGELDIVTPSGLVYADPSTDYRVELISSGDFEAQTTADPSPWKLGAGHTIETDGGHGGSNYLRVPADSTTFSEIARFAVTAQGYGGEAWMLEAWVRSTSVGASAIPRFIFLSTLDNSELNMSCTKVVPGTQTWTKITLCFCLHPTMANFMLRIGRQGGAGFDIDDITIRKV